MNGPNDEPLADLLDQIRLLRIAVAELQAGITGADAGHLRRTALTGSSGLIEGVDALRKSADEADRRMTARERRHQHLSALQEVTAAINSSLDVEEVLQQVMDAIIQLTSAERAMLLLYGPGGELEVSLGRNLDRESLDRVASAEISRSVVRHVATTGEPVLLLDTQEDERFASQESIVGFGLRSVLCVPLQIRGQVTGVIYADNRVSAGVFRETDRDALMAFADQAALAIHNARLFEEVNEVKELMANVLASISGGVVTIDAQDRIAIFNRAAERLFGVSATEILGVEYVEVLDRLNLPLGGLVSEVKRTGNVQEVELELQIGDNDTSLQVTLSPLRDESLSNRGGVAIVIDDWTELKRVESLRRYLPSTLVDQVRDIDAAQRPQRRDITVLFADIRNFSTIGEDLEPEELIRLANRFFAETVDAIHRQGGLIDKFVGDAVMALFNTPLNPQPDHVAQAARTALQIRDSVARLRAKSEQGPEIHFGTGIHSGTAVVGNVGSDERKDYSAVGDVVNLAKRLQEMSGLDEILISEEVDEAISDWASTTSLPPMQVKGRQKWENVYRLDGLNKDVN